MKYLLDTHIILWALIGDNRITDEVKEIVQNTKNEIYYSTASSWEVEIKHQKKENFKLSAEQFIFLCDQNGLLNLQIKNSDVNSIKRLVKIKNTKHDDPFNKMLLAQAISENMVFITHDRKFAAYSNSNIMIV